MIQCKSLEVSVKVDLNAAFRLKNQIFSMMQDFKNSCRWEWGSFHKIFSQIILQNNVILRWKVCRQTSCNCGEQIFAIKKKNLKK